MDRFLPNPNFKQGVDTEVGRVSEEMTDVQSRLVQKPESSTDASSEFERDGSDFERGLEELMRGHLDDCMSFGSCSRNGDDDDDNDENEGGDQLVRRRRRLVLEGDDLAETSAARRRQSRILSRWAARQAQEMITTIERRNHESELMALAGLHTVSMLDSSFLRESLSPSQSPTSRRQGNVERPSTRASSILQMWRELEDAHVLNRAHEHQGSLEDVSENDYVPWSNDQLEAPNESKDCKSLYQNAAEAETQTGST